MTSEKKPTIKKSLSNIRKAMADIEKASPIIVGEFRYLLENSAHKELGCKETQLVDQVECDAKSKSTLYRILTQARIEHVMGVEANTLRESWARKIQKAVNKLDLDSNMQKQYYKKIWLIATKKAGNQAGVDVNHIQDAIEYATVLVNKKNKEEVEEELEKEPTQPDDSQKTERQVNKESVLGLFEEIKHSDHRKKIKTIKSILSGNDDMQKIIQKLATLPENERIDLIALIESDRKLMEAFKK